MVLNVDCELFEDLFSYLDCNYFIGWTPRKTNWKANAKHYGERKKLED